MHARFLCFVALACACSLFGQITNLPGTQPLTMTGDLSAQMVAGIDRFLMEQTKSIAAERAKNWKRDFSSPEACERSIQTNRAQLAKIIGAIYQLVPCTELEFLSDTAHEAKLAETDGYVVYAIRWPVLE